MNLSVPARRASAQLVPGVEMFGVVRDEAGKGLPKTGIDVFPPGMNGSQIEYMETAADGSYRFSHLPVGAFDVDRVEKGAMSRFGRMSQLRRGPGWAAGSELHVANGR